MIQAIHMIDLLVWVLGMPRRVLAETRTVVHDVEVEDLAVGLLEFEGGVTATLQATTAAVPAEPPSVEIRGDRGTATVSGSWGHLGFHLRTGDSAPDLDIPAANDPTEPAIAPYAAQIADFVAAVRDGRSPLVDGVEARKALVVVDALYRSAGAREWATVDPGPSAAPRR
jgi:predicted dehydrogenase